MKNNYLKLFTSSLIIVERLRVILADNNINSIVKNPQESGRLAGFGTFDNSIELFVSKSDFDQAKSITNKFKEDLSE